MKISIIGGGPGGLYIAYKLTQSKNVSKITLLEQNENLGGCWRIDYPGGYMVEHSPKVITGNNFKKFLEELGLNPDEELVTTYSGNTSYISEFFKNLSFLDILKLTSEYTRWTLGVSKDLFVSEWCNKNSVSKNGKEFLEQVSILLADIPEKVKLNDIFATVSITGSKMNSLYQLVYPNKWIKVVEQKLLEDPRVSILKDTKANGFNERYIFTNTISIGHDILISTIPNYSLINILQRSPGVSNNWGRSIISNLKNSFYNSIGFQLHYDKHFDENTKKMLKTPFKIDPRDFIAISTSLYSKEFTERPDMIKECISCTIIDQTTFTDKKISECIDKITEIVGFKPAKVTINKLLENKKISPYFKYISEDTAFVRQGPLIKPKGTHDNLFLVHSFNSVGISSLDKTLKNCQDFLDEFLTL